MKAGQGTDFSYVFTCLDVDLCHDDGLYFDLYATCLCCGFYNPSAFYFCRDCQTFGNACLSLCPVRELSPDRVLVVFLAPDRAALCVCPYDPRRIWKETRPNGSISVVSTQRDSIRLFALAKRSIDLIFSPSRQTYHQR